MIWTAENRLDGAAHNRLSLLGRLGICRIKDSLLSRAEDRAWWTWAFKHKVDDGFTAGRR